MLAPGAETRAEEFGVECAGREKVPPPSARGVAYKNRIFKYSIVLIKTVEIIPMSLQVK